MNAVAPRLRWSFWERRLRKSRETEGEGSVELRAARIRSWMEMTLRKFLYFSMSFSKVGSRALEATYSADVVLERIMVVAVGGVRA